MNKQLINKYKPEFDHWLNDGAVLMGKRDLFNNTIKWYPSITNPFIEISESIIIIINDEYSIYRKALAEGKTIQYYDCVAHHSFDPKRDIYDWKDFKSFTQSSPFSKSVGCYRIKPIEFKLGDYVKLTSTTHVASRTYPSWFQIDGKDITLHGSYIYIEKGKHCFYFNELELWQPKPNEWCWFWDKCTPHRPTLRQYDIFPEGYGEENMFHDSEQNPFDFCEPFLNSRPSHLKDK